MVWRGAIDPTWEKRVPDPLLPSPRSSVVPSFCLTFRIGFQRFSERQDYRRAGGSGSMVSDAGELTTAE